MKRYIRSAEEALYPTHRLRKEEWAPKLNLRAADVRDKVLMNVKDQDKELFQYLLDNKVFPTVATSSGMRTNPYYDLEDKIISLYRESPSSRTYMIPYPGSSMYGEGDIYSTSLTIYDDGLIRFGSGLVRDPYKVKPSTLKKAFFSE